MFFLASHVDNSKYGRTIVARRVKKGGRRRRRTGLDKLVSGWFDEFNLLCFNAFAGMWRNLDAQITQPRYDICGRREGTRSGTHATSKWDICTAEYAEIPSLAVTASVCNKTKEKGVSGGSCYVPYHPFSIRWLEWHRVGFYVSELSILNSFYNSFMVKSGYLTKPEPNLTSLLWNWLIFTQISGHISVLRNRLLEKGVADSQLFWKKVSKNRFFNSQLLNRCHSNDNVNNT